jgi:hypothetical protein
MFLPDFRTELDRYRLLGERAMAQVSDEALNTLPAPEANSIAMIVRHISGNLVSRFTDFLTTDGEKRDRHRDVEFETRPYSRAEVEEVWRRGWSVLERTLAGIDDGDLMATVTIRQQPMTVHSALSRALAHIAYHVGQLVLLARVYAGDQWQSLSIPKGQSETFNQAATSARPRQVGRA